MRFLGILLVVTVFIVTGVKTITQPKEAAALTLKSNLGRLLRLAGQPALTPASAEIFAQSFGMACIVLSTLCLLGIARRVAAYALALALAVLAVLFHLNIDNVAATPRREWMEAISDVGVIGGLLILASLGGSKVKKD